MSPGTSAVERGELSRAPIFFLGGRDLEMVEIARVLTERRIAVVDHGLDWAHATFTAYEPEVKDAINRKLRPVLVELRDVPREMLSHVDIIDHHGPFSRHLPVSLEQVLSRVGICTLTREQALIAANDKGYIEGMAKIGATPDEIRRIRELDRQAQGITAEQEIAAEAAVAMRDESASGLTVVALPHGKAATVTDRLASEMGGPGYLNLLIICPEELAFFGSGSLISELVRKFGGYCGGQLPLKGYWGLTTTVMDQRQRIADLIRNRLASTPVFWKE